MKRYTNTRAALRLVEIFIVLSCLPFVQTAYAQPPAVAEWTVMVFMNGDNNLSDATGDDFVEMAKVGSDANIKVVTQIDRFGDPSDDERWGQTFRFYITKDLIDVPGKAIKIPVLQEQNMGAGQTLIDFVRWAKTDYPAKKYMLIIWDHGQGWRLMLADKAKKETDASFTGGRKEYAASMGTAHFSTVKSISHDETDKDELYNLEIRDALAALKSEKIDVLGFDACLMSMVETAYAFRDVAKFMVGSQEVIPNSGWQYSDWLAKLRKAPASTPKELAQIVVQSYKDTYRKIDPTTTLSAIDLAGAEASAVAIDGLAQVLLTKLGSHSAEIIDARNQCDTYAPEYGPFYHIDITRFCQQLIRATTDAAIKAAADRVIMTVNSQVTANYQGRERLSNFGSNGLCIYFPPNKKSYDDDLIAEHGYEKDNTKFPVEFVQKYRWADFIHAYLKLVP